MKRTKIPGNQKDDISTIRCFDGNEKLMFSMVIHPDVKRVMVKSGANKYIYLNNILLETLLHNTGVRAKEKKQIKTHEKEKRIFPFIPLAKKLYQIVKSNRNIHLSPNQIKLWANELYRLSTSNKVEIDRIERILIWYSKNIGGKYVPVVFSGYSFRTKFLRLEAAMERETNKEDEFEYHFGIKYKKGQDGRLYHARTGTLYIP